MWHVKNIAIEKMREKDNQIFIRIIEYYDYMCINICLFVPKLFHNIPFLYHNINVNLTMERALSDYKDISSLANFVLCS